MNPKGSNVYRRKLIAVIFDPDGVVQNILAVLLFLFFF